MLIVITMWQQYHSFTSAGRGQFYDYDSIVLQYIVLMATLSFLKN